MLLAFARLFPSLYHMMAVVLHGLLWRYTDTFTSSVDGTTTFSTGGKARMVGGAAKKQK